MNKPKVGVIDAEHGDAALVLGKCEYAALKAGWSLAQIGRWEREAMSGDYEHLLDVCLKYFDVSFVRAAKPIRA